MEKAMAPHSSTLAWKIPWTEEPGRLQSMGSLESDTTERLHFHFHAMEKEMATHSRVLAWRIPGTGEPGGVTSMGSHRVGHNWSDAAAAARKILVFVIMCLCSQGYPKILLLSDFCNSSIIAVFQKYSVHLSICGGQMFKFIFFLLKRLSSLNIILRKVLLLQ